MTPCVTVGILTDFGCYNSHVVLQSRLPVQIVISGNRSFDGVNVKTAVQLRLPLQRIPAEITSHMGAMQ